MRISPLPLREGVGGGAASLAGLLASGFGVGYTPRAPGTAGSLLATIAGAGLMRLAPRALPAAVAAASLTGLWAVRRASGGADAGWVVIDEMAGQWVALLGLARPRLAGLAAAFALFRLLDIAKPGPIGWADRKSGATAVMGDDLIAGAVTAAALWAMRRRFPRLPN